MRFTTARLAYNHGNRLGYLGYGVKPGQAVVGPSDTRAFRDIKLGEVMPSFVVIFKTHVYRLPDGSVADLSISHTASWPSDDTGRLFSSSTPDPVCTPLPSSAPRPLAVQE